MKQVVSQSQQTLPKPTGIILQRKCACGGTPGPSGECAECQKKRMALQRKLTIGSSNDPLEYEAERVADQVMAAPINSSIQSTFPRIQRVTSPSSVQSGYTAPVSVERVLASSGRTLEPTLQQDMGQRFGYDFSQVRVHTDSAAVQSARDVNAHAYTAGNNIVFGAGQFSPETHTGRHLIAHELTHVVQQTMSNDTGSQPKTRKTSTNQLMRSIALDSTIKICNRVLESRKIQISQGGVRVVLLMSELNKQASDCQDHEFSITLQKSRILLDKEIATCEASTGGNRSFSFNKVPSGTYYLTIARNFDNPNCCLEGDILVFDENMPSQSSNCVRSKELSAREIVHSALDIAGFIPVLGAIPDGLNAIIYVTEGNWADAGLSVVAMVPALGDGVKLIAMEGKSVIKISEKAAIKLGEEGIVKGIKEAKVVSKTAEEIAKAEKGAVKLETEVAEKVEKEAAEKVEKELAEKTTSKTSKEAEEKLLNRILECKTIYKAYDVLKEKCKSCSPTDTPTERVEKIACLTALIAGRALYLKNDCDDILEGSIKRGSAKAKAGHMIQLNQERIRLEKCSKLPVSKGN